MESTSISGSPRVDLSYGAKKTVTGGGSSTAEWSSGGFNGWRPEKLRFPAIWSMRLAKEGSRRKLGRLSSFGCGGFEIRGAELADSIDERELLRRHPWRAQGGEGDEGEAQEGARQVASSGEERGRLGVARRPGTGIGLHDGNDTAMGASGGVGAITATCSTGGREVGV